MEAVLPAAGAASMTSRRFPPPWHADPMPGGYVIRDANGQALAFVNSRDSDAEARQAKVLTKDGARRIAAAGAAASRERRLIRRPVRMPPMRGADDLSAGALRRTLWTAGYLD
jgi:hypothetical protein